MKLLTLLVSLCALFLHVTASLASEAMDIVVADEGVEITRAEFEAALKLAPGKLKELSAHDLGDRYEFISSMLEVRKLAAKADAATPDTPGYWDLVFEVMAIKRQFAYDAEVLKIEYPNPEKLAQEYYKTQKDKYATRPELRSSSHILLQALPGQPREELRKKAHEILDELEAGASFEDLVVEFSEDPGSRARNGSLDRWIRFGEPDITPPYSDALFRIEEVGAYSDVIDSQFGLHIIRLDGIEPGGYYEYADVRQAIFQDILAEFKNLASRQISAKYRMTDDAFIDGAAMDELFAPYKVLQ